MVLKGDIKLQYVSTDEQVVDMLTKLLKILSSQGGTMMMIHTFLARRNNDDDIYFPRKEEQ